MNLVYNLVIQQDSYVNTTIAQETKSDSRSMRVIAALTMIFLPGTFLASVFGTAFLGHVQWWLYVAITIPTTAAIVVIWWRWSSIEELAQKHFGMDPRPVLDEIQVRPRKNSSAASTST